MIEEVKDLIEDVKDKVGDKGFIVIVVCLVAVGFYLVYRSFNSSTSYYAPTSVTGYPTVGENADVVIDSVNNAIEGSYNDLSSLMDSRLEYIEGVMGELQTDINTGTNEIINNSNQNTDYIVNNSNQNTNSIIQNSNQNKQEITQVIEEVKQVASKVENTENVTQSYTPTTTVTTPKTTTTTTTKTSNNTKANTRSSQKETYTYTTKAGLNTNTSIVDALKATGTDSSFANRKKIAEANGIKGYTGSYSQNVAMLNKMKAGTLQKV